MRIPIAEDEAHLVAEIPVRATPPRRPETVGRASRALAEPGDDTSLFGHALRDTTPGRGRSGFSNSRQRRIERSDGTSRSIGVERTFYEGE